MNHQSKIRFSWLTLPCLCVVFATTLTPVDGYGQQGFEEGVNPLRPNANGRQSFYQNDVPPGVPSISTTPIRVGEPSNSLPSGGEGYAQDNREAREQIHQSTSPIVPTLPRVDGATLTSENVNGATRATLLTDLPHASVAQRSGFTEMTSEFFNGTSVRESDVNLLEKQLDNLEPQGNPSERESSERDVYVPTSRGSLSEGPNEDGQNSESSEAKPIRLANSGQLNELVERVVYYTLIVISLGVGFVAVSKIWQTKASTRVDDSSENSDLKVLNSIKLSSKVTLTLVGIGHEKVVVASDHDGVKSVIRIGDDGHSSLDEFRSFEDMMASVDEKAGQPKQKIEKPKPQTSPEPVVQPRSDRYTLDMIGKVLEDATRTEVAEPGRERPSRIIRGDSGGAEPKSLSGQPAKRPERKEADQAAIVAVMEAAMTESGLKELVLQSLKAKR